MNQYPFTTKTSLRQSSAFQINQTQLQKNSILMSSPTPPQDPSSPPNPLQRNPNAAEELLAWAAANQDGPPRRQRILPSERIDLSGRPGFATSGDWPKTKNIGGPVRILSKDGQLTELGKRVERERLAKEAAEAAAASDDAGKEKAVAGSGEESST